MSILITVATIALVIYGIHTLLKIATTVFVYFKLKNVVDVEAVEIHVKEESKGV